MFLELTAGSLDQMRSLRSAVNAVLIREKLVADPLLLCQWEGFLSVNPAGRNAFESFAERVLPASSAANLYPISYSGKTDPKGFFIGRDKYGTNIILDLDRRVPDKTNGNAIINYEREKALKLYPPEMLRDLLLGLHSMCKGADARFFNGPTNISSGRFLVFCMKGLENVAQNLRDTLRFTILSYLSDQLLTAGNTVAAIDELYLWLSNPTAVTYIRNCLKRVRKKESSMILASQNLEDFDRPGVRELTRPLFATPPISSCLTQNPQMGGSIWTTFSWNPLSTSWCARSGRETASTDVVRSVTYSGSSRPGTRQNCLERQVEGDKSNQGLPHPSVAFVVYRNTHIRNLGDAYDDPTDPAGFPELR